MSDSKDETQITSDKRLTATSATLSLVAVAVLAALLWRFELEWHGWEGLTWLGYFHWAVPVGVGIFLAWIGLFARFPSGIKRWGFLGVAAFAAPVLYLATRYSLKLFFARGPAALPAVAGLGTETFIAVGWSAVFWLPALPVLVALTGRRFGLEVSWKKIALSVVVFSSSLPVALVLMRIFDAPGAVDAIHAIKTGYVIPLLVIGLGVPFIPTRRADDKEYSGA